MKKIFLTTILATAAMNINAQLVVDSIGRVGVGTQNPTCKLSVNANGSGDRAFNCNVQGKKYGIYLQNENCLNENYTYGIFSNVSNTTGNGFGGRGIARGSGNLISTQYVIGMAGYAGQAPTAVGILGAKSTSS